MASTSHVTTENQGGAVLSTSAVQWATTKFDGVWKLLRWMREKQLVEFTHDEIKDMCENQLWEDTVRDMGL
jgi:hypothetical protein